MKNYLSHRKQEKSLPNKDEYIDSSRQTQRLQLFSIDNNQKTMAQYQQYFKFTLKYFNSTILEEKGQNMLAFGHKVQKYTKKGKGKHEIFIYLSEQDKNILQYISPKKAFTETRTDITKLNKLQNDPTYRYLQKEKPVDQNLILVLDDLHLEFKNKEERDAWWCGLQYYIIVSKKESLAKKIVDQQEEMIKKVFMQVDKDGNRELDIKEVKQTLKELHIQFTDKEIKKKFNQFDVDKSGKIEYNEFIKLMKSLSRKTELEKLFLKYAISENDHKLFINNTQNDRSQDKINMLINQQMEQNNLDLQNNTKMLEKSHKIEQYHIYLEQYLLFLKEEQHQNIDNISKKAIQQKIITFKKANKENFKFYKNQQVEDYKINFDVFCNMIFSRQNLILNPDLVELKEENMNYSLSDYYIKSSHNTYLMGNQLTGESNVDAYIKALNENFRCVELDCWNDPKPLDNDFPEPIVYHGHTLTSKITFREIIETINKIGFANNPYPIILSLENHCDVKNQLSMAKIMTSIFGDKLFKLPKNYEQFEKFPSPNDLKYKIIVKGKGKPSAQICADNNIMQVNPNCKKQNNIPIKQNSLDNNNDEQKQEQSNTNTNIPGSSLTLNRITSENSMNSQQNLLINNNNVQIKNNSYINTSKDIIKEENQNLEKSCKSNLNTSINKNKTQHEDSNQIIMFSSQGQDTLVGEQSQQIFNNNINEQKDSIIQQNDILIGVEQSANQSMNTSLQQNKNDNQFNKNKKSKFQNQQNSQQQYEEENKNNSSQEVSPKKKPRRQIKNRNSKNLDEITNNKNNDNSNGNVYLEDQQLQENQLKQEEINIKEQDIITQNNQKINEDQAFSTSEDESSIESDFEAQIQKIGDKIQKGVALVQANIGLQNDNTKLNEQNRKYSKYENKQAKEHLEEHKDSKDLKHLKSENIKSLKQQKQKKKVKLSMELQKCITMFGCHFSLEDTDKRTCWFISSLGESKLKKFYSKCLSQMEEFHKIYFTRIYPAGFRIDSSNYDPIPSFLCGSQVIALNVQKEDDNKQILHGKFQENGSCGYILKPEYLRKNNVSKQFNEVQKYIHFTIISGQQMRPDDFTHDVSDVVDPYVQIIMRGHENDEQDPTNGVKKTHVIKDNGFNPIFYQDDIISDKLNNIDDNIQVQQSQNQILSQKQINDNITHNQGNNKANLNMGSSKQQQNLQKQKNKIQNQFQFSIRCPEQAIFTFKVYDQDTVTDERLGIYSINCNSILPGYRVIPLYDKKLQLIDNSYLLVKIVIKETITNVYKHNDNSLV